MENDRVERLWREVAYDLKHYDGGPIHRSAEYLRGHPAMRELLELARRGEL